MDATAGAIDVFHVALSKIMLAETQGDLQNELAAWPMIDAIFVFVAQTNKNRTANSRGKNS